VGVEPGQNLTLVSLAAVLALVDTERTYQVS
jgi:hypothetical protein